MHTVAMSRLIATASHPVANGYHLLVVPVLLAAVLMLALGLAGLIRERASRVSVLFGLLTLAASVWLFAFSRMYVASDEATALWWAKAAYLGVPWIPAAVYHFTVAVLRVEGRRRRLAWICWGLSAFFSLTILTTGGLITGLYRYPWGYYPRYGWLSVPYLGYFFGALAASLYLYQAAYRQATTPIHRRRIGSLLAAFAVALVASVDYLPKYGIPIYPFGYVPVFVFVLLAARTIWRYRLVDITPALAAKQIIEMMSEALLVVERDGTVRLMNRAASELFGCTERELVGRPIGAVFDGALSPERLDALMRTTEPLRDHEIPYYPKQGQPKTLVLSASVIRDQTAAAVAVVCIARDITEHKRVQEELVRLASFPEDNPDPVIEIDEQGAVTYLNAAARARFADLLSLQSDHPILHGLASMVAAIRLRQHTSLAREVRLGESIYEQLISAVPHSRLIRMSMRDITERKALEQHWIQAQKFELIGQLTAGVAHEINTPIQYVGSNATFLQGAFGALERLLAGYERLLQATKAGSVPEAVVKELEAMAAQPDVQQARREIPAAIEQSLRGVKRVAKIVRSMRELSHPGQGRKTQVDLNPAIQSTITMAQNEWKYVAELVTDLDPTLPPVPCVVDEMHQAILNILINAAQAIGEVVGDGGTGKGKITVRTRRLGGWVEIRISDTGPGIPEAIRSKIFTPFFTTKAAGKGTGQGLAIAHAVIVQRHGGTIQFDSREGQGTTFVIRLPLHASDVPTNTEASIR